MLGSCVRLHDADTAEDLGLVHVPSPVCVGDLAATESGYRVVDVVELPASAIDALCKPVRPVRLVLVAT